MERVLGSRYRLGRQLGQGAMGEVFAGADTDGHEYAFKILRRELTADPAAVARFLQERSILVRLRHPNLVGVHDLVAEGDTVGIVMDLVRGGDLRRLLAAQGPLLPAEAARIGSGIAAGLAAMHQAGVFHRDVKPENVLLDDADMPPSPRLTDFGISRLASQADTGRSTLMVGTPQYVAPELVDGAEPTPAVDLYALGIVLYEMCCGVTPFAGGSVLAVLRRHAEMSPGRPDGIPDPLWDLISWLLAKSPRGRPQSAQQVATVLDALATDLRGVPVASRLETPPPAVPGVHTQQTQGVGAVALDPSRPVRPARRSRRARRGRLVVATAAALALLAGGWAVARPGDPAGQPDARPTAAPSSAEASMPVPTETMSDPATTTATATATATVAAGGPAPDLVGKPLSDAQGLLPSSVTIEAVDTVDEKATDGTVLVQDPKPGAPLTATMRLEVARQPVLAYLDGLDSANGYWDYREALSVSGKTYPHSLGTRVSGCHQADSVEYNLSRGYRKLVTTAGLDDNAQDSSLQLLLEIFADGRRVSASTIRYGKAVPLEVDLTGVLRLKLQWQPTARGEICGENILVLGDARLLGLPGEVPQPTDSPTP